MGQPTQREILLNRLSRSKEVEIAVTGRKTKRRISTPVWFVLEGERVTLVPTKGSDNEWFKNLVKDPEIELGDGGISVPFNATVVRDSSQVEKVLDKFRAKYRSMWSESYYTKRDVYVEVTV
jgi:deazaflavin-dependent oxidoreductase (nitroreductase family)